MSHLGSMMLQSSVSHLALYSSYTSLFSWSGSPIGQVILPSFWLQQPPVVGNKMKKATYHSGFLLLFHISRWSPLFLVIRTKQNWLPYSSPQATDGTLSSSKSASQAGLGSLMLSLVQDLHFWTCVQWCWVTKIPNRLFQTIFCSWHDLLCIEQGFENK